METTILMPLLNEGTDVWRPVVGKKVGDGLYRVAEHPSDDEEWAFPAGSIVMIDRDYRIVSAATA